jgi:nitroimidazol reductase NimA-like FMN-containing flavoprotein (pyridoxamine 5'-phosphate oxidase superfamily)
MDASIRAQILRLLDEHRIMSLATLRPDGWPQATTVGYINDGLTLYFLCGKESQKAKNLARDNRVSLTIDRDTSDPLAIRGLSMAARATTVPDQSEIQQTMRVMLPKKYPEYGSMMGTVDLSAVVVFKVTPEVISVLDYSKGFGHCELVTVEPADRAAA